MHGRGVAMSMDRPQETAFLVNGANATLVEHQGARPF
jgi:hypothetical protein